MSSEFVQMDNRWISKAELVAWEDHKRKMQKRLAHLMFGTPDQLALGYKRRMMKGDEGKLAYVLIGNTQFVAFVNQDRTKAYKTTYPYIRQNICWKRFKFIRWLTSFDV